jgi:hypothetical protein
MIWGLVGAEPRLPKGRDETGLPYNQAWVRERDKYGSLGGA